MDQVLSLHRSWAVSPQGIRKSRLGVVQGARGEVGGPSRGSPGGLHNLETAKREARATSFLIETLSRCLLSPCGRLVRLDSGADEVEQHLIIENKKSTILVAKAWTLVTYKAVIRYYLQVKRTRVPLLLTLSGIKELSSSVEPG